MGGGGGGSGGSGNDPVILVWHQPVEKRAAQHVEVQLSSESDKQNHIFSWFWCCIHEADVSEAALVTVNYDGGIRRNHTDSF